MTEPGGSAARIDRTLVIGVGNEYRGDDGVGLHVIRDLRRAGIAGCDLLEESGEGGALMECWKERDVVILVDAVRSGSPPGTIHRIEAHKGPVPAALAHFSSHAFGIAEAIELSRILNRLPEVLIIYGIEGKSFTAGSSLSAAVEAASAIVRNRIVNDLASCNNPILTPSRP